jgi:predicted 3-demethylubiquinone-9 3-methyltransferase (glyoxalase superfamily)
MPSPHTQKLTLFLVFKQEAEEAMNLYTSIFKDAEVIQVIRAREGEPGWVAGTLQHARFAIGGQELMCINTPPPGNPNRAMAAWEEFDFNPAMAIYVQADSDEEFDRLYAALADGGTVRAPVGRFGFSPKFAWVDDRYGVSWRLNLAPDKAAQQ